MIENVGWEVLIENVGLELELPIENMKAGNLIIVR